jgi:uncharacterized membrane protein YwzB
MNKFKIRTLLQLLLFTLYVVWLVLVAFKIDINSLMHVASVQEDLLQRILLVFSLIGIVLTFFYLNTLKNDQTKEKKNNTKSLLAMYIVVAIMTLYSTDIAKYFKSFI